MAPTVQGLRGAARSLRGNGHPGRDPPHGSPPRPSQSQATARLITFKTGCQRGMGMQLNPYLMFNGQCEAAFQFYEQALGGEIAAMMNFGDSPMAEQAPAELRGQIMHARLVVGDAVLMGSDAPGSATKRWRGVR